MQSITNGLQTNCKRTAKCKVQTFKELARTPAERGGFEARLV